MENTQLLKQILQRYREINRRSRAVNLWTYYGSSGCVRRATCIFCRHVVATCSGAWPETIGFRRDADAHCEECAMLWYVKGQVDDLRKNIGRNK